MSSFDDDPVPVTVIGAGNMGANHIRVYDELPGANLVEVVEPNTETAATIREEYDVRVHDSVSDIEQARAATIAVPNDLHLPVARQCITDLELDVLIEKPLANTVADAREIVDLATDYDAILQVGHIERYNPAVETLAEVLQQQDLIALEAHRLGPFNEHLADENVVLDLMIHDIDIVTTLSGDTVSALNAIGTTDRSDHCDHAIAQFSFENGPVATVTASQVTSGKIRTLSATTRDAYITLDYQEQSITLQRRGQETTTTVFDQAGYRTETITESPYVRTREPLKQELEHFLSCVRERRTPRTDGESGLEAVRLASEITDAIKNGV
ncbi:Gfo/Idh/MocA family protein [Halobellus sp. EA9]|uniref:Gfo/Idh/MocA family protein n=1 Tax=Halobellus sp. EA9 TaxID=3421647 RepID=UPI003EBF652F